jgi:hypothetical protein
LKNLVGINGNKEFLPHHRKGGASHGGDCYDGGSRLKMAAEELLDAANRGGVASTIKARLAEVAVRGAKLIGGDENIDGSWYGNDTVWRMCLDLQRVLRYARIDGTLARVPQRRIVTITDGIVAGEREGPLAPSPVSARVVTGAVNPAAAEWVHAGLMGFDPCKIPLVREAFAAFPYPVADFPPSSITVRTSEGSITPSDLVPLVAPFFQPPAGWKGHIERQ